MIITHDVGANPPSDGEYSGDGMKKIISVIVLFVLTVTTLHAASINGDFKGNPIVKVTTNGKELKADKTPAILYNGNTMVPIAMLKQLGATVEWDQKKLEVTVTLPNSKVTSVNKVDESDQDTQKKVEEDPIPKYSYSDAVAELGFPRDAILTVDAKALALELVEVRKTKRQRDYSVRDALWELGLPADSTPTLKLLELAVRLVALQ